MDNNTISFIYHGWNLATAIDALMAYDSGCLDSGVYDPEMKIAVVDYLTSLSSDKFRQEMSVLIRDSYLTDVKIEAGYGVEDVKNLFEWLEQLGIDV